MDTNLEKLKVFLEKAAELGYMTEVVSEEMALGKVIKDNITRFIVGPLVPLNTTVSAKISKDKFLTKKLLHEIGIQTPQGGLYKNLNMVFSDLDSGVLKFPLVVKPNDSALGNNVYVNLTDKIEIEESFNLVLQKNNDALVEEFFPWNDYRLFVVDGVTVATARRIPPFVIGDGISKVSELLQELNLKKEEKKVREDIDLTRCLEKQLLTLDSVPENGQKVQLRGNANIQTGGFIEELSDSVSGKFKEIAEQAAKHIGMKLAGVDILSPDITDSNSDYVVTEINGLPSYPYIHGHPDFGIPNDPIDKVLEAMFRE